VLRVAGTEALLAGRTAAARRRWAESLAAAEALGMRPERARTRLEMGRRLSGDEAARLLEAARAELDALGLASERDGAAKLCPRA
jgi:hypothetical protein